MKIIIEIDKIKSAIQRKCEHYYDCDGDCIECAYVGKNEYIEIDEKIKTKEIVEWLDSQKIINKLTE